VRVAVSDIKRGFTTIVHPFEKAAGPAAAAAAAAVLVTAAAVTKRSLDNNYLGRATA